MEQVIAVGAGTTAASEGFLDELYGAVVLPEKFQNVLDSFTNLFGAEKAALYVEQGGSLQRSLPQLAAGQTDRLLSATDLNINDLVGTAVAARSGVRCGKFRAASLGEVFVLAMTASLPDQRTISLVAIRRSSPFTEIEQRKAAPLLSQFERACGLLTANLSNRIDLGRSLFEESTIALVLTRQRMVERANEKAKSLFAARRPVAIAGRQLTFEDARIQTAFDRFSEQKTRQEGNDPPTATAGIVAGAGGSSWLVQLSRISQGDDMLLGDRHLPVVMVALTPFYSVSTSRELPLQGFTELSAIEQSILRLIVDGNDAPGVAASMGRSCETIRWHIKRMYPKLGVTSQADLGRLGALLMPIAPKH